MNKDKSGYLDINGDEISIGDTIHGLTFDGEYKDFKVKRKKDGTVFAENYEEVWDVGPKILHKYEIVRSEAE